MKLCKKLFKVHSEWECGVDCSVWVNFSCSFIIGAQKLIVNTRRRRIHLCTDNSLIGVIDAHNVYIDALVSQVHYQKGVLQAPRATEYVKEGMICS